MDAEIDGMEPVNLGNPNELTINELLTHVVALTGTTAPVVHRPLPVDDPRRRRPDIARARDLLDWEPRVALAEGLSRTCDWFAAELARNSADEQRLACAAE